MRAINANLLIRLTTRNDAAQVNAAEAFVAKGAWIPHLALMASGFWLPLLTGIGFSQ